MEGFERPPTRRGGGRDRARPQQAAAGQSSVGANLSAEDLQRRLLAIGNAAKARNPDGFVDELKRRVGPGRDAGDDDVATIAAPAAPSEATASWFCLEPGTHLERALARGDTKEARRARGEATRTLQRVAADGALTDAWCRALVREGADVGAVFGDAEAAARMLCSPWPEEKVHCVGYLALAAPYAAAASIVKAVRRHREFSSYVSNIAEVVDTALKRRGLPAPQGWRVIGPNRNFFTREVTDAVLQALVQLDDKSVYVSSSGYRGPSPVTVGRTAEAILREPEGSLDLKHGVVKHICRSVLRHQEGEGCSIKEAADYYYEMSFEVPKEDATATAAALKAAQKTLQAGARASQLLATLEKAAPEAAAKAETWTRAEAVARGDAAERARLESEARASKQRDALSERIADLETALTRATQAATRKSRVHENEASTPADASTEAADDTPRGVVEAIRRARLVDVDLSACPAAVQAGARGLQASLAAAAERLAGDLYEHRAHFVHELVQNADDSTYTSEAELELGLEGRWFYAASNQAPGFTKADVIALCDINKSTKRLDECTTGSKGIGFKAVFAVADVVTVLSKDYQFGFDTARDGAIGLVSPRWLDSVERLPRIAVERHAAGATVVVLELNGDEDVQDAKAALEQLGADEGRRTLLFARRLRNLSVRVDDEVRVLARSGDGPITVGDEAYRVFRKGKAVVAFGAAPACGWAHATLPICALPRSFGFSVNAPFDVVASRGALRTSAANVQLRQQITAAVLDACHNEDDLRAEIFDFLKPDDDDDGDAFWSACRREIVDGLARGGVACVRCDDGELALIDAVMRWPPEASALAAALRSLGDVSIAVRGRRLARRAPAVAPEFGVEDLLKWLCWYKRFDKIYNRLYWFNVETGESKWSPPEAWEQLLVIGDHDDAIFAALLAAEPHLWPRLRKLCIIRVDDDNRTSHRTTLNKGLLVLGGDVAAPAVGIYRVAAGGPARRAFLERHGARATISVEDAFAYALDNAAARDGVFRVGSSKECDDMRWWALLDLLRRTVAAGEASLLEDPRASTVIRVPLVEGAAALAQDVNQATFFGAPAFLPPDLDAAIGALVGDQPSTAAVATRTTLTAGPYPARCAAVEWEALLDGLGCRRPRLDELGFEVKAAAGAALASPSFWPSLRPFAMKYVERRLDDAETLAFLRCLPAKRVDGGVKCLRDLFLRDVFYPLCGGLLPYAFETNGGDDFPSLSTKAAQASRSLVAKLVRSDPSAAADAHAALEVLAGAARKNGVFQAAAALYGAAAPNLAAAGQPWVLVSNCSDDLRSVDDVLASSSDEDDLQELKLELASNCVWDDDAQLCRLARAKRLSPFYAGCRGAEQALVAAGVEPKLGKCRDFLAILDALRGSVVDAADAATLARECYRRLAETCVASTADRAACANSFVSQRLILIPKPGGAVLVALRADEAYWDVAAHLRHTALDHYALSHHFDASLRPFFVDVVGTNPELLEEPEVSSNGHTMPGTGEPSTIQDGLRGADLAAPPDSGSGAGGTAPTEALARAALARVADGDSSRLPPAFRSLPASLDAFAAACRLLGVNPRAVTITEPDRCAFLLDGCVILSAGRMRRVRRDDTPFLVTELLHGLAHAAEEDHGPEHDACLQALHAYAFPRLAAGGPPPPPTPAVPTDGPFGLLRPPAPPPAPRGPRSSGLRAPRPPCRFFARGMCRSGDSCRFSHDP